MSTLNTTFAGLRLSSPVIVGSCSLTANIDKLNPVNAPDLWIVHPLCGLDPAKGVEKFRPKLTAVVHLNEMSHAKDRWRHTYESGLACVKKIEAAGGKTVMPLWGERLGSGV